MRRFRMLATPWIAALTLALSPAAVLARDDLAPRERKLSTAVGPAFALGRAGALWAARIGEKSSGRMLVKLYPGATLAQRDPAREFAALRDGGVDLAVGASSQWAGSVAELGVVGLPWLAPDDARLAALATPPFVERLAAGLERAGVVAVAFAPLGHRALATIGKPVREPADLEGLAVRVPAVPALFDLYATLAAVPKVADFASAQAAFKAGTLGGQDGAPATFVASRVEALGFRHVIDWQAIGEIAVFAVNRKVWSDWSEAERLLVRAAATEAAAELAVQARAESAQALAELRQRGLAITRLTAEGHAAFAAASRAAWNRAAGAAGEDLARAAEAAVRAAADPHGSAAAPPQSSAPAPDNPPAR